MYLPAMILDDTVHHGKSQTCALALLLCREIGLEYFPLLVGSDPYTGVGYAKVNIWPSRSVRRA